MPPRSGPWSCFPRDVGPRGYSRPTMSNRASTPVRRSHPPLWLVEGLDIAQRRRPTLLAVTAVTVAIGAILAVVAPGLVPPVPLVGAAVAVAGLLLGLAAAVALDATDLRLRGPRHVGAAGGELVAVLPVDATVDAADPLAAAVLDARDDNAPLLLGLAAAGRNPRHTAAWTDVLARALVEKDVSVLSIDLATGRSESPGLVEVVRDKVKLTRAVRFEPGARLARLGAGADHAEALASLSSLPNRLPRDLDVLLVALPTAASRQVVDAVRSLDHVLIVAERDETSRVDLIAGLDALDAAGTQAQVALLDDVTARRLAPRRADEREDADADDADGAAADDVDLDAEVASDAEGDAGIDDAPRAGEHEDVGGAEGADGADGGEALDVDDVGEAAETDATPDATRTDPRAGGARDATGGSDDPASPGVSDHLAAAGLAGRGAVPTTRSDTSDDQMGRDADAGPGAADPEEGDEPDTSGRATDATRPVRRRDVEVLLGAAEAAAIALAESGPARPPAARSDEPRSPTSRAPAVPGTPAPVELDDVVEPRDDGPVAATTDRPEQESLLDQDADERRVAEGRDGDHRDTAGPATRTPMDDAAQSAESQSTESGTEPESTDELPRASRTAPVRDVDEQQEELLHTTARLSILMDDMEQRPDDRDEDRR